VKRHTLLSVGLGLTIALTGAAGLTGCSSSESKPAASSSAAAESTSDVAADLTTARQAVLDALKDKAWAQVMLASDVSEPTVKYGLMVMPFVKTDKAERVTGTVNVDGGKFVIEAVSAADGKTWQIDQDGTVTEAKK
jgi:hypothetical protein